MNEQEILVYDVIEKGASVSVQALTLQLAEARELEASIYLKINSPGGQLEEAISMYQMLKDYPYHVKAMITGTCASAATVLLFAADERIATPYSKLMIHEPRAGLFGTSSSFRKGAEMMDTIRSQLLAIYKTKVSNLSDKNLLDMLAKETWMTPEQALSLGFIDKISTNSLYDIHKTINQDLMVFNQYKPSSTISKMEKPTNDLQAQIDALQAENKAYKEKLEAMQKNRIEAALNSAIQDGRIKEEQKAVWTDMLEQSFDNASTVLNSLPKPEKKEESAAQQVALINPAPIEVAYTANANPRADWTIRDWEKKDAKGLGKLKKEQPEVYNQLFNQFYK